jgi:biopolymer transport protein ExbD
MSELRGCQFEMESAIWRFGHRRMICGVKLEAKFMLPLRFVLAGIALLLPAFALFWVLGNLGRADPFAEFRDFEKLIPVEFLAMSLGGAGIFSILKGLRLAIEKEFRARQLPRIFPETKLRNLTAWKSGSVSPSLVMSSLNSFSVSWICVLMVLLIIFMMFGPRLSKGLRIDWKERRYFGRRESVAETMSVYIAHRGQFYVNENATKRQELELKLRAELARRAVWTVYLEADDDTAFMDTVYAIDTIQGLGAKVLRITPRMRAEWKKQNDEFSPTTAGGIRR